MHYHWSANRGEGVLSPDGRKLAANGPERWEMLHKTGYTLMIGRRLKRIREGRHLTQMQVADRTRRPKGGTYSQGLLSRIEAGYANAPLYTYIDFANFYELDPGRRWLSSNSFAGSGSLPTRQWRESRAARARGIRGRASA